MKKRGSVVNCTVMLSSLLNYIPSVQFDILCSSAVHCSGFYDIFLVIPGRVKKQTLGWVMIDYELLHIPIILNHQPDI